MARLVYDAGMLVALERRADHAWSMHEQVNADRRIEPPYVPVMVLAQVWRGGPQHRMSRVLRNCRTYPVTEGLARAAGALCGRTYTADVVDALVVIVAAHLDAAILTSDVDDITRLVEAVGAKISVHRV